MTNAEKLRLVQVALRRKHDGAFFTEVAVAMRRMDVVVFDYVKGSRIVTGYEIKVDHSDFISDQKWIEYLPWCKEFYFACPKGLIAREEVPDPAGLMYCYAGTTRIVKKAVTRPMDDEVFIDLMFNLIWHRSNAGMGKTAIMNNLTQYAEEKISLKELGNKVGYRLSQQARDIIQREDKLKREREYLRNDQDAVYKLHSLLKRLDMNINNWHGEEKIENALSVANDVGVAVGILIRTKEKLKDVINLIEQIETKGAK